MTLCNCTLLEYGTERLKGKREGRGEGMERERERLSMYMFTEGTFASMYRIYSNTTTDLI